MHFYKPKNIPQEQYKQFKDICFKNYQYSIDPINPFIFIENTSEKERRNAMGVVVWKTKNTLIIATAAHCLPNNTERICLTRKEYNSPQWIVSTIYKKYIDIINPTTIYQKELDSETVPYITSYKSKNINEDLWFIVAKNNFDGIKPKLLNSIISNQYSLAFAISNTHINASKINIRSWSVYFQPKWISDSIRFLNWQIECSISNRKNNLHSTPYYEWMFVWSKEDYQNNKSLQWQSWSPVFLWEHLFWITNFGYWSKTHILCWLVIQQRLSKILAIVENKYW